MLLLTAWANLRTTTHTSEVVVMKVMQKRSRKTGLRPGRSSTSARNVGGGHHPSFNYAGARCDEQQDLLSTRLRRRPMNQSPGLMSVASTNSMCSKPSAKQFRSIRCSLRTLQTPISGPSSTITRPTVPCDEDAADHRSPGVAVEQVSLVLGRNFVLSFQDNGTDVFKPVRDRLRGGKGRLRQSGADYLLHALVDAIVDHICRAGSGGRANRGRATGRRGRSQTETLKEIHALKRQHALSPSRRVPLRT